MKTAVAPIDKRLVLAVLGFGLARTAWADEFEMKSSLDEAYTQTQRFGISPFFGYRFGGEVEDPITGKGYSFDDAPAYGLTLDYAPVNR